MDRASDLARVHRVTSVFVGIAGREGDLLAPEFIDFVESALRMEDVLFRLLRERAVVLLADVDRGKAEEIFERLRDDFSARFATASDFEMDLGFYQVDGHGGHATAKVVLPVIFGAPEEPEALSDESELFSDELEPFTDE
jgi:GGDEF domain-containing protein